MTAAVHSLMPGAFSATGARPVTVHLVRALRAGWAAARTVRTRGGLVLFDERGRYVGLVRGTSRDPAFGAGAEAVLLVRTL
jgi:hypothetical protein